MALPPGVSQDSDRAIYEQLMANLSGVARPDDTAISETDVTTSASVGTWVELMPANSARLGASVQAAYASGNVFIKQQDSGLPTSGKQVGELQIPAAPAYYEWTMVTPKRRYVMRADTASLVVALRRV